MEGLKGIMFTSLAIKTQTRCDVAMSTYVTYVAIKLVEHFFFLHSSS